MYARVKGNLEFTNEKKKRKWKEVAEAVIAVEGFSISPEGHGRLRRVLLGISFLSFARDRLGRDADKRFLAARH